MSNPEYFIDYRSCKKWTLEHLRTQLQSLPKKCASSIQIGELCIAKNYPNGIYLFYEEDNQLWYVGKATSRSFVDRIPAHFDVREGGWFNTLPKKIFEEGKVGSYEISRQKALSLRLVMIGMECTTDDQKIRAGRLESILRSYLQPRLNSRSKPLAKHKGNESVDYLIRNFSK